MWLLMLACTTEVAPIPSHGSIDPIRWALASENDARIDQSVTPFLQDDNQLTSGQVRQWAPVRRAAQALRKANVRSEWHAAYASLTESCRACHQGQTSTPKEVVGHGEALAAFDEGMMRGDTTQVSKALEALSNSRSLTNVHKSMMLHATRASDARSTAVRERATALLYGTCLRCHGKNRPIGETGRMQLPKRTP